MLPLALALALAVDADGEGGVGACCYLAASDEDSVASLLSLWRQLGLLARGGLGGEHVEGMTIVCEDDQ